MTFTILALLPMLLGTLAYLATVLIVAVCVPLWCALVEAMAIDPAAEHRPSYGQAWCTWRATVQGTALRGLSARYHWRGMVRGSIGFLNDYVVGKHHAMAEFLNDYVGRIRDGPGLGGTCVS